MSTMKEILKMDQRYRVYDGHIMIAQDLFLDVAMILVKGYFKEHPNSNMTISIEQYSKKDKEASLTNEQK